MARYSDPYDDLGAGFRLTKPFACFVLDTGLPIARKLWTQARNKDWLQKRPQTKKKSAEELAMENEDDRALTVEDDWRCIIPGEVREHEEWPAQDVAVVVYGLSADEKERAKLENWEEKWRLEHEWTKVEEDEIGED